MSYPTNADVRVVLVPRGVALPPGNITALDWSALTGRVDVLEEPHALSSHSDVDDTGVTDGETLIYDSSANGGLGGYVTGDPSGAISDVDGIADVDTLTTGDGLTSSSPGTGEAELAVSFAGTGSAATASRSDHTHNLPTKVFQSYAASGALSSGSRVLTSVNVTPPNGVPCRIIARLRTTEKSNGAGSGYFKLFLNIWDGTTSQTRTSEQIQCVGGVPNPATYEHTITATGDGTAWPVSASIIYDSGDPTAVGAGELTVEVYPAR